MRLHLFSVLAIFISDCIGNSNAILEAPPAQFTEGVYILNEGNFSRGNSTLSFYLPESQELFSDVFKSVNGRDLGDIGNDIVVHESRAYIVVNVSEKIEIISTIDHSSVATVKFRPGTSPYRIAIAPNLQRAYVTNLLEASVSVLDLNSLEFIVEKIEVGDNPWGLAYADGKVYVCNSGFGSGRTVSVIDGFTHQVINTIAVSENPTEVGLDSEGKLWIVCSGNFGFIDPSAETPGKFFVLNPTNDEILDSIEVGGHLGEIAFSNDGFAYVVGDLGIIKIDTENAAIVMDPFIPGVHYTVAVDGTTNEIYVSDGKDFVQNGVITVHTSAGVATNQFEVGVAPGSVAFVR